MNCQSSCCFLSLSPSFASSSSTSFHLLPPPPRSSLAEPSSSSVSQFQNDKTKKTIPMFQNASLHLPNPISSTPIKYPHLIVRARRKARDIIIEHDDNGDGDGDGDGDGSVAVQVGEAKGSGTTARGRRLLKVREEKRKRDYDRIHNYPDWAKVLEDACKNDNELRAVLGDSIGNPELMRERIRERVRQRGPNFNKSKNGSVLPFKVSFRDFSPLGSHIWFEFLGTPTDRDVDLFGSAIQSWYVMGRLGAFNSCNLQLASSSIEKNPLYDADKGSKVMPSSIHDISDVEFQDNWGRVWVDLGTCDFFAIDVLLNCLTVLSSEYLGIKQVVFGGRRMGDWEEGMTSSEDGYRYFKI